MTAQELQGRRDAGAAEVAALEADLARQEEIFEGRREELLSAYPDKLVGVCAGEVFVGDTDVEVISKAEARHPDRPVFISSFNPAFENEHGAPHDHEGAKGPAGMQAGQPGVGSAIEEDLARQEEIFEGRREELLSAYPDKLVGVCAGEVFVGDTDVEVISKAEAKHPDRPVFLSGKEMFCGCW